MSTDYKKLNQNIVKVIIIITIVFVVASFFFLLKYFNSQDQSVIKSINKNDGSFINIYDQKENEDLDLNTYKNIQGQIKPVNTTIVATKNNDYKYVNTTNNFQSYFKDKIDKNKDDDVKLEREGSSVSLQIINRLIIDYIDQTGEIITEDKDRNSLNLDNTKTVPSPNNQKNRIRFSNIYQKDDRSIDIEYAVNNNKLTEEFTLNKFINISKIYQKIKLNNAYLKVEGSRINIYQMQSNKLLWFIPQPQIYEKNNPNILSKDIHFEIKCIDEKQDFLKNPDSFENCDTILLIKVIDSEGKKWLSDPSRNFPVIIDPDFQIDNADTSSNWVSSDSTNFTVSQETTIKHENTASVKITATNYTCWSTDGSTCNSNCRYGTRSAATTTYSSCVSSECGSDGCWGINYVCIPGCDQPECEWYGWTYYYHDAMNLSTYQYSSLGDLDACVNTCYTNDGGPSTVYTGDGSGCGGGTCPSGSFYSSTSCIDLGNSSLNDTVTLTRGSPLNLSEYISLDFWVYASTPGSYLRFQLGEASSGEQAFDFSINSANTWEKKTWDITGINASSRDAILYFAFKNIDATSSFTFYFDDIVAVGLAPDPPTPPGTCAIKESDNDSYLVPFWKDNSSDESGFQLEKSINSGPFSFITNLAAGTTAYQDNIITPNNSYSYRLRSYILDAGSTIFSDYCNFPVLNLNLGNFKFEGLKLEGIKIN